jgi:hypothetical protein
MRCLQLCAKRCNLGAALLAFGLASVASGQDNPAPPPPQPDDHPAVDTVKFLTGAVAGLALHEAGHLLFDALFQAQPRVVGVHLGPFGFFAITHRSDLPPRREFTVSSAGFWVQESADEWLLTRRPSLGREHAPLVKGVLAFNLLNSVGYALVAFARAGPPERDTRGMSEIGVDERVIGAIVLAPAILDGWRYVDPDARVVKWASRAAKIGSVLLVMKRP